MILYEFTKDSVVLSLTDEPNWIRMQENGNYGPCDAAQAEGVAIHSTAYNLPGHQISENGEVNYRRVEIGDALLENAETSSIAFVVMAERGDIDDVTAGEHRAVFAQWQPDVGYLAGQLRNFDGGLYRCLQAHTSQTGWEPSVTPALWSVAADPAEEWPEWSQPIGAADAYGKGARVTRNGEHWVSEIDGNVWEPGVYGWVKEVV